MQSSTPMSASVANMLLQLRDGKSETNDSSNGPSSEPSNLNRQNSQSTVSSESNADREYCHCKKSKCLKLYCQCFALMAYCASGCRCVQCENSDKFVDSRSTAIQLVLERNPNAFDSKFRSAKVQAADDDASDDGNVYHKTGCRCRKSMCLKKYCECYQAGIKCNSTCTCLYCCNTSRPSQEVVYTTTEPANERSYIDLNQIASVHPSTYMKPTYNLNPVKIESQYDDNVSPSTSTEDDQTNFPDKSQISALDLIISSALPNSPKMLANGSFSKPPLPKKLTIQVIPNPSDKDIKVFPSGSHGNITPKTSELIRPAILGRTMPKHNPMNNPVYQQQQQQQQHNSTNQPSNVTGSKRKFLDQILSDNNNNAANHSMPIKNMKLDHGNTFSNRESAGMMSSRRFEELKLQTMEQIASKIPAASPTTVNIASALSLLAAGQ